MQNAPIPISEQDFLRAPWGEVESAFAAYAMTSGGDGMQRFVSPSGRVAISRLHLVFAGGRSEFRRHFLRVQDHPQTFLAARSGPDRDFELMVGGVRDGVPDGDCMPVYFHTPEGHLNFCFNPDGTPVLFQ